MTKPEFVSAIVEKTGMTKRDVKTVVDAALEVIPETLAAGEHVQFVGFGSFGVRERESRFAINPATKKKYVIEAHKVPFFKPGELLKKTVNE